MLSLFVELARASLPESAEAVNLVLRTAPTVWVHLRDGSVHRLLHLLEGESEETAATHLLSLLLGLLDISLTDLALPLGHADKHILLGLKVRVDGAALSASGPSDEPIRHDCVTAEDTAEYVLRVEGSQKGEVSAHARSHDEKLVGPTAHLADLSLHDLLHVLVALRLDQVLARQVPGAAATLVVLLEDDGSLHADHVYQLLDSKQLVGGLAEEVIDVGLRVLPVIVQEDQRGVPRVDQGAIWGADRLVHDVIAHVVLHQTVLGLGFLGFFSAHLSF